MTDSTRNPLANGHKLVFQKSTGVLIESVCFSIIKKKIYGLICKGRVLGGA